MRREGAPGNRGGRGLCDVLCALVCFLLILCVAPAALAIDEIDAGRTTSLTVAFAPEGRAASGVRFRLYRVADMAGFGTFTLCGDFAGYPVQVNGLDSEGWRALANTLEGYVAADQLSPLRSGLTDSVGSLTFGGLSVGLYLVTGELYIGDKQVFTPQPVLIALPNRGEDDLWIYGVTASVKYDAEDRKPIRLEVIKVWKDGGDAGRPVGVTVQLMAGGQVVDTVVLSAANNWRYTWVGLDASEQWQVVERPVPSGYTVQVSRSGSTVTITNTRPTSTGTTSDPKLPQTGLLWWPVPLLALAGMALFVLGWMRRRGHEDEA